jgi:EamA domain-containing membrane protein RarD
MNETISVEMNKDRTIYVSLTGVGSDIAVDVTDRIEDTLDDFGLNNSGGYWILMLVLMAGAFYFCRNSGSMRVVMPLVVLGIAMSAGWLDAWVIVLLSLAAAFGVYVIFRRTSSGV